MLSVIYEICWPNSKDEQGWHTSLVCPGTFTDSLRYYETTFATPYFRKTEQSTRDGTREGARVGSPSLKWNRWQEC